MGISSSGKSCIHNTLNLQKLFTRNIFTEYIEFVISVNIVFFKYQENLNTCQKRVELTEICFEISFSNFEWKVELEQNVFNGSRFDLYNMQLDIHI